MEDPRMTGMERHSDLSEQRAERKWLTNPTRKDPTMGTWDDPDLKVAGDFVKFANVGDRVAGTITAIRKHRFEDGSVAAQILLTTDEGEEKTLTAGQVRLKAALAEKRPEAGDHITVTLTQVEKRSGGKTLKHFDVEVKQGAGATDKPPF